MEVFSAKTDCFTVLVEQEDSTREISETSEDQVSKIGSWRVSKRGDVTLPFETLQVKQLTTPKVAKAVRRNVPVQDEWNTDELCDLFSEHRRVMVRAEYAGCGKSYACKAMEKRGLRVLFVCPTNKLVQNNRENGVTLNQFSAWE